MIAIKTASRIASSSGAGSEWRLIIRRNDDLVPHGLTTAAAIRVTAALGCAAGLGHWPVVVAATLLALGLLFLDHSLETRIQQHHPLPEDEQGRPKEP